MEPTPTDLSSLKVTQLKDLLREKGLPVSGTKVQLIERLSSSPTTTDTYPPTTITTDDQDDKDDDTMTPQKRTVEENERDSVGNDDVNDDEEEDQQRRHVDKRAKVDREGGQGEEGRRTEATAFSFVNAPAIDQALASEGATTTADTANGHGSGGALSSAEIGESVRQEPLTVMPTNGGEGTTDSVKEEDEQDLEEYNFEPEVEESKPTDMYLDTIDRSSLDFDFERLCSVTLSHNHIYCCLVCGKFFQGRGKKSAAYAHSIGVDHHVFINLDSKEVYVLPDGYQVSDPSLSDIQYLLSPSFTESLLSSIDHKLTPHYDLVQNQPYYPGFIGLNNIKHNSYINSILVSLAHVRPLRDYFILNDLSTGSLSGGGGGGGSPSELVKRFSNFLKKFWNPKLFKPHMSPHELLQQIDLDSGGKFKLNDASSSGTTGASTTTTTTSTTGTSDSFGGDPGEFLSWFLNKLHRDLGGNKKPNSSIIYSIFQGELRIDDQQVLKSGEYGTKPKFDLDRDIKSSKTPFLFLTLDLPPPPLFQSHLQNDIIPQVSLTTLLSKYNGDTTSEILIPSATIGGKPELQLRRYKLERLPEFVVLWVKRFKMNRFGEEEKNPTIVNFPLRGLDFKDYVDDQDDLSKHYDLVSNVTHTSLAGTARTETQWKSYVHLTPARDVNGDYLPVQEQGDRGGRKGSDSGEGGEGGEEGKVRIVKDEDEKWFEMQDLNVSEIEKGLVGLGESYIQIWERRRPQGKHDLKIETPKPKLKGVAGQIKLERQRQLQQQQQQQQQPSRQPMKKSSTS